MPEKLAKELSSGDRTIARWDEHPKIRGKSSWVPIRWTVGSVETNGSLTHIRWQEGHIMPLDIAADTRFLVQ